MCVCVCAYVCACVSSCEGVPTTPWGEVRWLWRIRVGVEYMETALPESERKEKIKYRQPIVCRPRRGVKKQWKQENRA